MWDSSYPRVLLYIFEWVALIRPRSLSAREALRESCDCDLAASLSKPRAGTNAQHNTTPPAVHQINKQLHAGRGVVDHAGAIAQIYKWDAVNHIITKTTHTNRGTVRPTDAGHRIYIYIYIFISTRNPFTIFHLAYRLALSMALCSAYSDFECI